MNPAAILKLVKSAWPLLRPIVQHEIAVEAIKLAAARGIALTPEQGAAIGEALADYVEELVAARA